MSPKATLSLVTVLALTLGACQRGEEVAKLDNQIAGNDADPAMTSALEDQILVDPALTQQSNKNAVRPAETPMQAQYPTENGPAGAAEQARLSLMNGDGAGCGNGPFNYDMAWAKRLPADLSLYPNARVTEAAGNNERGCSMRVVTFASADRPERVLEFYRGRALNAGYSAEQQRREGDHVLAGTNPRNGGHYYLIVTPKPAGSEVALIANNGA
ncbi:MAG TPA: hypothetical protein VF631_12725 [Allosphingosinicella sp.]|jgi:hypothetical protein|uniref:hypothetical protein n=1 Tax=Allosphingosinicella sp. TaxID=2823234 RepID=UPI002F272C94